MTKPSSREKIMDAAIELFYFNGFNGTSIRAITNQANVNVSLISYYFKNKQGLLEQATVNYYEYYLEMLESLIDENPLSTKDDFLHVIEEIIHYKEEHFQFTCFIQRELTLDNQFIRELFATYVAKETYYFKILVEKITERVKANKMEHEAFYLQFKSLINGPFIYGNEWKREYEWDQSRGAFIQTYITLLNQWFAPLLTE